VAGWNGWDWIEEGRRESLVDIKTTIRMVCGILFRLFNFVKLDVIVTTVSSSEGMLFLFGLLSFC
jgi:hypothetical protein